MQAKIFYIDLMADGLCPTLHTVWWYLEYSLLPQNPNPKPESKEQHVRYQLSAASRLQLYRLGRLQLIPPAASLLSKPACKQESRSEPQKGSYVATMIVKLRLFSITTFTSAKTPPCSSRPLTMDRQVTFAFPPQVFGKRIADTFSDEDDEKLRQRIRSKLDGKVHGEAAVGHIFSLENGGPTCRDNVFMQDLLSQ